MLKSENFRDAINIFNGLKKLLKKLYFLSTFPFFYCKTNRYKCNQ